MKLDIEAMALEAGLDHVAKPDHNCRVPYFDMVTTEELEAYTRLIVERCAQEAEDQTQEYEPYTGQPLNLSYQCAAAIRNLLEPTK